MRFGNKTRDFIADTLRKIAEYLFSIVILATIISTHFNWKLLIGSSLVFLLLTIAATMIIATTEKEE